METPLTNETERTIYVLYENPSDSPGKFVVRRATLLRGAVIQDLEPTIVADSLDDARGAVPAGFVNIGRYSTDDPVIREVWA